MATLSGTVIEGAPAYVSARLYARVGGGGVGFIPATNEETLGTLSTITDDTGAWSLDLTANSLIEPANTLWQISYSPSTGPVTSYWVNVPTGGGWIGDCIVDNPGLPDPTFSAGGVISVNGETGVITGIASQSDLNDETNARAAADMLLIPLTQKAAASGVATLDGTGKIPAAQLPGIAIGDVFVVGSEAAMLALAAQTGDVAKRTDLNESFILQGVDPTVLSNWVDLGGAAGGGSVDSVNGRTGIVTGLAEQTSLDTEVTNRTNADATNAAAITAETSARTTSESALAPKASPTFTGTPTSPVWKTTGLTGATAASRYVGATAAGAPASGSFLVGDYIIDQTGAVYICTVQGSPGTWVIGGGAPIAGTGISVTGSTVSINTAVTVDKTTAQTLTNKTLTAPVLSSPTGLVAADIPSLDAAKVTTGTFATARLGSGSPAATDVLLGNSTWGAAPADARIAALLRQQYK